MNWLFLLLGIIADHAVTEVGIRRHGLEIEGNPLFGWSWRRLGSFGSLLLQAAMLFPMLWLAERLLPEEAFLLPTMIWLIVAFNLVVLAIAQPER